MIYSESEIDPFIQTHHIPYTRILITMYETQIMFYEIECSQYCIESCNLKCTTNNSVDPKISMHEIILLVKFLSIWQFNRFFNCYDQTSKRWSFYIYTYSGDYTFHPRSRTRRSKSVNSYSSYFSPYRTKFFLFLTTIRISYYFLEKIKSGGSIDLVLYHGTILRVPPHMTDTRYINTMHPLHDYMYVSTYVNSLLDHITIYQV